MRVLLLAFLLLGTTLAGCAAPDREPLAPAGTEAAPATKAPSNGTTRVEAPAPAVSPEWAPVPLGNGTLVVPVGSGAGASGLVVRISPDAWAPAWNGSGMEAPLSWWLNATAPDRLKAVVIQRIVNGTLQSAGLTLGLTTAEWSGTTTFWAPAPATWDLLVIAATDDAEATLDLRIALTGDRTAVPEPAVRVAPHLTGNGTRLAWYRATAGSEMVHDFDVDTERALPVSAGAGPDAVTLRLDHSLARPGLHGIEFERSTLIGEGAWALTLALDDTRVEEQGAYGRTVPGGVLWHDGVRGALSGPFLRGATATVTFTSPFEVGVTTWVRAYSIPLDPATLGLHVPRHSDVAPLVYRSA